VKISIYPLANYLPKTKEEKAAQGKAASYPNLPKTIEIASDDDLINAVTSYAWSPSVFSSYRKDEFFVSADFMALDIDSGLSIAEAEERVQKLTLACLCLPSPSHTSADPRFRLVFPLAKTIFNEQDFHATWDWLQQHFPELDTSCSDTARFFCASSLDDGFFQDGELLVPVKAKVVEKIERSYSETQIDVSAGLSELVKQIYGKPRDKIPESVAFFLENASSGLPGLWTNSLNAFAYSLALSGIDDIIIEQVAEQLAPQPLDKSDLYQISRAVRDGAKKREDL
jgi:hypothetical protein